MSSIFFTKRTTSTARPKSNNSRQKTKEQQHPKLVSGLTQDKLIPAAKPVGETDSETDSETDKPRLPGIHSRTSVDIQKQCWSSPIKCRLQPTSTTTTRIIHYYAFYWPNYFTTILITSSSNQSQANNVFCNSASTTRQNYYSCAWSATPQESKEKKKRKPSQSEPCSTTTATCSHNQSQPLQLPTYTNIPHLV